MPWLPIRPLVMIWALFRRDDFSRLFVHSLRFVLYCFVLCGLVLAQIFARERIPPFRKDVLTKSGKTVGGGDVTRKAKLLNKQKRGKARMKTVGSVELSQDAFHAVLQR